MAIAGPGSRRAGVCRRSPRPTFDLRAVRLRRGGVLRLRHRGELRSAAPLSADGKWTAVPRDGAAYTTRLLVRRPATRARFNGTVVARVAERIRRVRRRARLDVRRTRCCCGTAGRGSASLSQYVGVSGGPPLNRGLALKEVDPARYGAPPPSRRQLTRTTSSRRPVPPSARQAATLYGGSRPKRSCRRRRVAVRRIASVTYVDAVHPLARL